MLTIRSPLQRGRPDRIVNEPALLFLLALNVLHITILNFDAVALTEGTPPSAFVSGLVLVLGASAGAFLFMILLRRHGLRRDKCRNGDKGREGQNSQRSHDGSYRKKQFAAGSRPILSLPALVLEPGTRAIGMGVFASVSYLGLILGPALGGDYASWAGNAGGLRFRCRSSPYLPARPVGISPLPARGANPHSIPALIARPS